MVDVPISNNYYVERQSFPFRPVVHQIYLNINILEKKYQSIISPCLIFHQYLLMLVDLILTAMEVWFFNEVDARESGGRESASLCHF